MLESFIIRLAIKLFPLQTPPEYVGLDRAALNAKYRKREIAGILAFFIISPLLAYFFHAQFIAYAQGLAPSAGSVYRLTADANFWYVPASFLGVVAACLFIHAANRVLLPDGGREYRYWFNANAGFAVTRLFLAFGIMFAAGGVAMAYFAARTHMDLDRSGLVICRMWTLQEERHPYSDIIGMKNLVDKNGQPSAFLIEFSNAEPWTTAQEVIFPEPGHKAFLEQVTARKIETISK